MAKKRKTRQQKILADLRHNFNHAIVNQKMPSVNIPAKRESYKQKFPSEQVQKTALIKTAQKFQSPSSANAYPYLIKDLSKTGILTVAILTFQITLFFLLKNHILIIPGLNY